MKILFSIILSSLLIPASAQYYDPMRPPAFALRQMKLEKLKKQSQPILKAANRASTAKTGWALNSILFSATRQHAIINGQLVRQGAVINGAKLMRIGKSSVQLKKKGKTIVLKLGSAKSIRIKSKTQSLQEKKL